jgi:hypothetical protein
MNDRAIAEEATRLAAGGVDFRTIQLHFESKLGRALEPNEGAALLAAWRAAGPARAERHNARAAKVAASLREP